MEIFLLGVIGIEILVGALCLVAPAWLILYLRKRMNSTWSDHDLAGALRKASFFFIAGAVIGVLVLVAVTYLPVA
jgi:hypothetical protein